MLLHDDIVELEKPEGICSLSFMLDEFSGLFLDPSIFSIKHSRPAWIINDSNFRYNWLSDTIMIEF